MDISKQYPGIKRYLDDTDDYVNKASEFVINDDRYLLVTQEGAVDGGQILFRQTVDGWLPVDGDTNIDVLQNSAVLISRTVAGTCGASSAADHDAVHALIQKQVDKFSSANGPDGGNLACVWTVRQLVHQALGRWITRSDGTSVFDAELQKCYGSTLQEADVPAGGIIISPTLTRPDGSRNIGHVGLLGPGGTGEGRLIYSNSSSAKKWKQNFTLKTWIDRYRKTKGLKIRFYPLPLRQ